MGYRKATYQPNVSKVTTFCAACNTTTSHIFVKYDQAIKRDGKKWRAEYLFEYWECRVCGEVSPHIYRGHYTQRKNKTTYKEEVHSVKLALRAMKTAIRINHYLAVNESLLKFFLGLASEHKLNVSIITYEVAIDNPPGDVMIYETDKFKQYLEACNYESEH